MSNFDISGVLNKLLEQSRLSESALGRAINIPRATINRLAMGRTPNPRATTLQAIADYFDITVEQLLGQYPLDETGSSKAKTSRQPLIPVLNWDDAIRWKEIKLQISPVNYERWVIADNIINENMFALEVTGEAMWPQFQENSILFIDPEKVPKNRDFVIYYLNSHQQTFFRQLFVDHEYKFLKPINNIFPTFQIIEGDILMGVVVQARNNYL